MPKKHFGVLVTVLACASLIVIYQFRNRYRTSRETTTKKYLFDLEADISDNLAFELRRNWSKEHLNPNSTNLILTFESKLNAPNKHRDSSNINLASFESKWNSWNATLGSQAWEEWLGGCCGGYISTHSGCKIARWYYSIGEQLVNPHPRINLRDCDFMPARRNLTDPDQVQENDTVYVTIATLQQFVDRMLNKISVNFVLISGQADIVEHTSDATVKKILDSERVLRFFCQNLARYGGLDRRHPKLIPFPYGLKGYPGSGMASIQHQSFRGNEENSLNKTELIYAGPLGRTHGGRKRIPQEAERLPYERYLQRVGSARYILSPDGDRPDCHRHYEAILLGTVPITQLDPFLYRHLEGAPVVFANRNWNLTSLAAQLDPNPVVNRNLILEEYWMDWVDHAVGFDLKWSDDLNSAQHGFREGPDGSWAPISDKFNDWVSVSDAMVCYRYSFLGPGTPEWGISGKGNEGITRHIACCSDISISSDPRSKSAVESKPNAAFNSTNDDELHLKKRYKPIWFDRESGWKGTTYEGAVAFCSKASMKVCPYDAYCPRGTSGILSTNSYN